MKKILTLLTSLSLGISSSIVLGSNVVSCNITPKETADYIPLGYELIKDTQKTLSEVYTKWNQYKNQYIKGYMVQNYVIKVDNQKFENNSLESEDIKNQVIDIFNSNLRIWKMIDTDKTLNPNDIEVVLNSVEENILNVGNYKYRKFNATLKYKNDTENVFEISGRVYNYDFVPVEVITEDSFKQIVENIQNAKETFIWQQAFITIQFNGNKKTDTTCTEENVGSQPDEIGCDWDSDQWVSVEDMKKDNLDFLSVRLRSVGIIPNNKNLNIDNLEIDVFTGLSSWNVNGGPSIDPNDSNKIIFKKENDFGPHSVLFKTSIKYSKDSNEKIETWGSYLKKEVQY